MARTPRQELDTRHSGETPAQGPGKIISGRPRDYGRRDFLRAGALLGVGAGAAALAGCGDASAPVAEGDAASASESASPAAVSRRVVLGRTGVEVPDIGFGTFALDDSPESLSLVHYALDRGVTHFDTAEGYADGRAEVALGHALAGRREQVTITTKIVAAADARADALMKRLEESLRRLRTDHVDFFLNHAVDDPARMSNPEWSAFVARAREQGKLRFSGLSGHGPSLVRCLDAALASGQLDVILVGYNYIQSPDFLDSAKVWLQRQLGRLDWVALQPELPSFLERAKAAGVGVMAMKTLRGARHNDLRPYERRGATFSQAALRWVLSDPRVDAAVISMTSRALVDEYLVASGGARPTGEDVALLSRYEWLNRERQCVQGCGACESACPSGVPIAGVLRALMYERDYEQPEIAARTYAELPRSAAACASCTGAPCASVCPTGVSIRSGTLAAHSRLAAHGPHGTVSPPGRLA